MHNNQIPLQANPASPLTNGLVVLHSNHLETLADTIFTWCKENPLNPLEKDIFLVQSNGMADWLKLKQAQFQGISAANHYPQPASFLWELYRSILDEKILPLASPFDYESLKWRIYSLLPTLISKDEVVFQRPKAFLYTEKELDTTKLYQLSNELASLYDAYQLYRSDWLLNWQKGAPAKLNSINLESQKPQSFKDDELWQMKLWRALVTDIREDNRYKGERISLSRAELHHLFIETLQKNPQAQAKVPRRIILFGVNSLPAQLLAALYELIPYAQIIALILNPSEMFWEDLSKEEEINHPLLDNWGGRGRDFLKLLREHYEAQPETIKSLIHIDEGVAYPKTAEQTLIATAKKDTTNKYPPIAILNYIQQTLQENSPRPQREEEKLLLPANQDPTLRFTPHYSAQREVEALHDQLLTLFSSHSTNSKQQTSSSSSLLSYHDVVVMMPDISKYKAIIEAVFNRYQLDDPYHRYLPYSISDHNLITDSPLYQALEYLFALPEKRLTHSEISFLLKQEAIRKAFAIEVEELPLITAWLEQTNIKWGYNGISKRTILNLDPSYPPSLYHNNSWQQGLDRLLGGYLGGEAPLWGRDQPESKDVTPLIDYLALNEVSGLQGEVLGKIYTFITTLKEYQIILSTKRLTPSGWHELFYQLLEQFFIPSNSSEEDELSVIENALTTWLEECSLANFETELPLTIAKQGWLDTIQIRGQSQKLTFNGVMFCTLMPMRALPFKHIYLLGMNDGDYPRETIAPDFDLLQYNEAYRIGDRDRRADDQYLFLEALLSARESLTVSWVGRDITDGTLKEPSVLVRQLQDYLDDLFTHPTNLPSKLLTFTYPLTPFSRRYFAEDEPQGLNTYAYEWHQLYDAKNDDNTEKGPVNLDQIHHLKDTIYLPLTATTLEEKLTNFTSSHLIKLLKNPSAPFFEEGLGIYLTDRTIDYEGLDKEPLTTDGLSRWLIRHQLLLEGSSPFHVEADEKRELQIKAAIKREGFLPAGPLGEAALLQADYEASNIVRRMAGLKENYPESLTVPFSFLFTTEVNGLPATSFCEELLPTIYSNQKHYALFNLTASNITDKEKFRLDKLAKAWVNHLLATVTLQDKPLYSFYLALNGSYTFKPLSQEVATQYLQALYRTYLYSLQTPLPLGPKTGVEYLAYKASHKEVSKENSTDLVNRISTAYHSGLYSTGDNALTTLNRAYPTFEDFWRQDGHWFTTYADLLYKPLIKNFSPLKELNSILSPKN